MVGSFSSTFCFSKQKTHCLTLEASAISVIVKDAEINKTRFSKGIRVSYKVPVNKKKPIAVDTPIVRNTLSPVFNHEQLVSIPKITQEHLNFFEMGSIVFHVYGIQEDTVPDAKLAKMTTKELRTMNNMKETMDSSVRRKTLFGNEIASDQSHLKAEVVLLQRKYDRLAQKERRIQEICKEWEKKPPSEQDFEPFFRAVSAAANSSGTRLKTRVQLLNQVLKLQKFVQNNQSNTKAEGTTNVPPSGNSSSVLHLNKTKGLSRQKTMDPVILTNNKAGGTQKRPSSAGGNTNGQDGSKACVLQ